LYQDNLSCRSLSFYIKYSHQKKEKKSTVFFFYSKHERALEA
jgi:hypothetical protein